MASPQGPATTPPTLPSLDDTLGCVLLGTFFALILHGVALHQTYRYFRLYPKDVPFLKVLVVLLFIMDLFHTASIMHVPYHYLIRNYFDPAALQLATWSMQIMPCSTDIIVVLAQCFYARRIYLVNQRYKAIVYVIGLLMLAELALMISASTQSFRFGQTYEGWSHYTYLDSILFAVAVTSDLILTSTLVIILHRSRTAINKTNMVLDKIAVYAVIATCLNTAITIPAFICSIAFRHNFIYIALAIPLTKVYSNSVLAIINARASLADRMYNAGHETLSLGNLRTGPGHRRAVNIGETVPSSCAPGDIKMTQVTSVGDGTSVTAASLKDDASYGEELVREVKVDLV